jgi:hypothetical protein
MAKKASKGKKKRVESAAPSKPLWMWFLIFLLPLVASELMFYIGGRKLSMFLFPVVWIGFWVALLQRSGWAIFKKQK